MKAIVYINGLIGSWEDDKGLELTDVVAQIQAQNQFDEVEVRIGNSIGGVVQTGMDIYNYLKSLNKPITTIIENYCASITSIIFLAGQKRLMKPGARLMIHNPWGMPSGDADLLQAYSDELRKIEKDLANIYHQKTNIGKEALTALMRNETEMTVDEALKLGFATGTSDEMKIAAYFKLNTMDKKPLKEQLKDVLSKLSGGGQPVNLTIQDGTGKEIVFDTEGDTPQVGDKATIDNTPAEGEITMPDGKIFVFDTGELKEIKEPVSGDDEMAVKIKEIVKAEVANAVKAAMGETNQNLALVAQATGSLTDKYAVLAKSVKSSYKVEKQNGNSKMYNQDTKDDVYSRFRPKKQED
jgi:ATP-dependent Clp protease, protease subunit